MKEVIAKYLKWTDKIEIIYMSNDEKLSQRIVSIQKLTDNYLIGFCHNRNSYRKFKIENILSVLPIQKRRPTSA